MFNPKMSQIYNSSGTYSMPTAMNEKNVKTDKISLR